ncbi:MAG: VWA domain-containing protein [Planctomycetaceae bacterium]|nr:VWA domain-containing protein [Planctomycetaceae bacterium]
MKIPVQCDRCGRKMLIGSRSRRGRCACGRDVYVPQAIAAMPVTVIPDAPPQEQEQRELQRCAAADGLLARMFPWLVSGLLHLSLGLVLMLVVVMVTQKPEPPAQVQSGYNSAPSIRFRDLVKLTDTGRESTRLDAPSDRVWKKPELVDPGRPDKLKPDVRILAPGLIQSGRPTPGDGAIFRIGTADKPGGGPRVPDGLPPDDTVFVIDRSGSMSDTFSYLCDQINREVARLSPRQRFAVVLFDSGVPIEFRPNLAAPTDEVRLALARFLFQVKPTGQTDPQPALKRAFAVLKASRGPTRRQLVHLLTDGEFPDSAKALGLVRALNPQRFVQVNTYLYGGRSGVAESTLKTIAAENHGGFFNVKAE